MKAVVSYTSFGLYNRVNTRGRPPSSNVTAEFHLFVSYLIGYGYTSAAGTKDASCVRLVQPVLRAEYSADSSIVFETKISLGRMSPAKVITGPEPYVSQASLFETVKRYLSRTKSQELLVRSTILIFVYLLAFWIRLVGSPSRSSRPWSIKDRAITAYAETHFNISVELFLKGGN